jgi:hypothetical protein
VREAESGRGGYDTRDSLEIESNTKEHSNGLCVAQSDSWCLKWGEQRRSRPSSRRLETNQDEFYGFIMAAKSKEIPRTERRK